VGEIGPIITFERATVIVRSNVAQRGQEGMDQVAMSAVDLKDINSYINEISTVNFAMFTYY
jgi:hypothetical protein